MDLGGGEGSGGAVTDAMEGDLPDVVADVLEAELPHLAACIDGVGGVGGD